MSEKENPNINADSPAKENPDVIVGMLINTPPLPVPAPEDKPLDRVKPPTEKKRSRERER